MAFFDKIVPKAVRREEITSCFLLQKLRICNDSTAFDEFGLARYIIAYLNAKEHKLRTSTHTTVSIGQDRLTLEYVYVIRAITKALEQVVAAHDSVVQQRNAALHSGGLRDAEAEEEDILTSTEETSSELAEPTKGRASGSTFQLFPRQIFPRLQF